MKPGNFSLTQTVPGQSALEGSIASTSDDHTVLESHEPGACEVNTNVNTARTQSF
jgi:hypothetical protein